MNKYVGSVSRRRLLIAVLGLLAVASSVQGALLARRHYYGGWTYYPSRTYYYTNYYYYPTTTSTNYRYHYCVHYPTQPRYVYYYNPYSSVYWGRYDCEEKGYSLLAEKDRKADLKEIPEKAFPKPGEMPEIPESTDGEKMLPIDPTTLPKAEVPKDIPAK